MKRVLFILLFCFLTAPVWAQSTPTQVVKAFYNDYDSVMVNNPSEWMQTLMAKQSQQIEKPLADMLVRLANGDPNKSEPFLDFDPFSNSQVGMGSYTVGQPTFKDGLAYVPVNIRYENDPGPKMLRLRVVLRKSGQGGWKIANVAYPAESGMPGWDLRSHLKGSFNP